METNESLVKYVAEMHDRRNEYGYDPVQAIEELEEKDSTTARALVEAYKGIAGDRVCARCRSAKMYDEKNEEYYCPVHG